MTTLTQTAARTITCTTRRAVPAGPYRDRMVYRVPVVVRPCDPELEMQGEALPEVEHLVLAATPEEAANWAMDHLLEGPGTVTAYGPLGGTVTRRRGYEGTIAAYAWARLAQQRPYQLHLCAEGVVRG